MIQTVVACILLLLFVASSGVEGRLSPRLLQLRGGFRKEDSSTVILLNLLSGKKPTSGKKAVKHSSKSIKKVKEAKKAAKVLSKDEELQIIQRQKNFQSILGAFISVGSMLTSRMVMKLNYQDPKITRLARFVFVGYILFAQLLYWYLRFMIKRENNKDLVIPASNPLLVANSPLGNNPLFQMLGGMGNRKTDVPLTVEQYDLKQNKDLFTSLIQEIIGVTFIHGVFKMKAPLLMVPMWGVTNRLKSPLIMLRIFGMKAVGPLSRPFKGQMEIMMENMMQSAGPSVSVETTVEEAGAVEETPKLTKDGKTQSTKKRTVVEKPSEEDEESEEDEAESDVESEAVVDEEATDDKGDDILLNEDPEEDADEVADEAVASTLVAEGLDEVETVSTSTPKVAPETKAARPRLREVADQLEKKFNTVIDDLEDDLDIATEK